MVGGGDGRHHDRESEGEVFETCRFKKKKLFVLHSVIPLTTVPPESKLPVSVSLRFVFIASGEARLFII